jgi:hypothetical protein
MCTSKVVFQASLVIVHSLNVILTGFVVKFDDILEICY